MGLLGAMSCGDREERSIGQWGETLRAGAMQPRQKLCAQVWLVVGSTKGILKSGSERAGAD